MFSAGQFEHIKYRIKSVLIYRPILPIIASGKSTVVVVLVVVF